MKKLTALLLCLLLLCPIALAEAVDFSGTWYLHTVGTAEMSFSVADLGMNMTLDLKADGSVTMVSNISGEETGTWTQDGNTVSIDDGVDVLVFTLNEEGLLVSGEFDGQTMIFGREEPTPAFAPAAAVVAEDVAQFDGTWIATYAGMEGMVVPAEMIASEIGVAQLSVVIDNGTVVKFDSGTVETATLADGVLTIPTPYTAEEDPDGVFATTITLLEDGMIDMNYGGFSFYCALAVEEAVEADPAA